MSLREPSLGGEAKYVLTNGKAHLPECPEAQAVSSDGGRIPAEGGIEYARGLGFEPCGVCLSNPPIPTEAAPEEAEGNPHRHYWREDGTCRCGATR